MTRMQRMTTEKNRTRMTRMQRMTTEKNRTRMTRMQRMTTDKKFSIFFSQKWILDDQGTNPRKSV
jgi:hypothetical protein